MLNPPYTGNSIEWWLLLIFNSAADLDAKVNDLKISQLFLSDEEVLSFGVAMRNLCILCQCRLDRDFL